MKTFITRFQDPLTGQTWDGPRVRRRSWELAEKSVEKIRLKVDGELVEEIRWGGIEGWNLALAAGLRRMARWLENLSPGGGYEI